MNAIATIDVATLTPATVFAPGGVEAIVAKIEAEVSAEVFTLETPEGRERIRSVAYKVARSKTALDDMGKELVAGIKAQSAAIDAERRTIRERLDALKESVRGPLTAWEDAEAARVADLEGAIVAVIEAARQAAGKPASLIRELIQIVAGYAARDWQEFKERADVAVTESLQTLNGSLAAAEQNERDAAELAELRQMKADREEADRKAEAERIAAQQAAERKAYEDRREKERAEKAERDQAAAVEKAIEAERQRAEQDKAAAVAAEQRRHEKAARDAAQQKAAEEAETTKREANKRHRAAIHRQIIAALIECGFDAAIAPRIAEAIANDHVPHVSIQY